MKNIIYIIIILIFFSISIFSQWQPDVRFTNAADTSKCSNFTGRNIAISGSQIHVVWCDKRDGSNYKIYYKNSSNGGSTWSTDRMLSPPFFFINQNPKVAVSGSVVHVVWESNADGNFELYYKRSPDNGVSWGPEVRLTNNSGWSYSPSIASSENNVHIVWNDNRETLRPHVYTKRSTDGGITWSSDYRLILTSGDGFAINGSIALTGNIVHVVFTADLVGLNDEIYYMRSPDNGLSWGSVVRLTNFSSYSEYPVISASDSTLHLVWQDYRYGNYEVFYKHSYDLGLNWGADLRLTNNAEPSVYPYITGNNHTVHLVWQESRDGNPEIYYNRSTNNGVTWTTDVRLTNNPQISGSPSAAILDSALFVVWQDNRDGNYEIYLKKNPTANPIGILQISAEVPTGFSMSQNYPNPFNPATNIKIQIPVSEFVKLSVIDITGKEVAELVDQTLSTGTYNVEYNASDLASGVYFYRITTPRFSDVKKMILVK